MAAYDERATVLQRVRMSDDRALCSPAPPLRCSVYSRLPELAPVWFNMNQIISGNS